MQAAAIAVATSRDDLSTIPRFGSLDEVPEHGVTVGPGTIVRASRRAVLLLLGETEHERFRRVVATAAFDPAWPATMVHRCRSARVVAERAASVGDG